MRNTPTTRRTEGWNASAICNGALRTSHSRGAACRRLRSTQGSNSPCDTTGEMLHEVLLGTGAKSMENHRGRGNDRPHIRRGGRPNLCGSSLRQARDWAKIGANGNAQGGGVHLEAPSRPSKAQAYRLGGSKFDSAAIRRYFPKNVRLRRGPPIGDPPHGSPLVARVRLGAGRDLMAEPNTAEQPYPPTSKSCDGRGSGRGTSAREQQVGCTLEPLPPPRRNAWLREPCIGRKCHGRRCAPWPRHRYTWGRGEEDADSDPTMTTPKIM